MQEDRDQVANVLSAMSHAWRDRDYQALSALFHPDMVIAAPGGLIERIVGRDACVESYRDFQERARITAYAEEPPWIGVWGPTAAASYAWVIAWEDDDGDHSASGRDVVALSKTDDGWRVVGRLLLEQTRS